MATTHILLIVGPEAWYEPREYETFPLDLKNAGNSAIVPSLPSANTMSYGRVAAQDMLRW